MESMLKMKISIGSDHRGFDLKTLIINSFPDISLETGLKEEVVWEDVGCISKQRCDYPIYAKKVANSILNKHAEFGILICGSGIGMAIAANRFKGIYAALCTSPEMATVGRSDDNINVLVLPSGILSEPASLNVVSSMLKAWMQPLFKRGRYKERLDMVDQLP